MSFFDTKPPVEPEVNTVPETPEKIKIGEEEFDPSELQDLIGKGRFAKEVEEKYNTKLDKVWPEYTKATQKIKDYEEKEKTWMTQQAEQLANKPQNELSEEELSQQARMQAKKLGLVTIDDINTYVEQRIGVINRATELNKECDDLEKEFNGKDGRPKFDREQVYEHMKETGIRTPMKAYKDLYEEQLDKWKENKFKESKKPSMYTENGLSGNHEPSNVKITKSNIGDILREVLNPQDEG